MQEWGLLKPPGARCIDPGLDKTQWTNSIRWNDTLNHHRLQKRHSSLQTLWILCLFILHPDSRTLISRWNGSSWIKISFQSSQAVLFPGGCVFLPHCSLPVNFPLICFNRALYQQPAFSAVTFCGLPSLWRLSMIVFWTVFKSAVFPMMWLCVLN